MYDEIKLGVSGDAGSFSEEAAFQYAQRVGISPKLHFLIDMENVLAAIESNLVDVGIFPVVNLNGGLVNMAFKAMGNHLFTPIDEVWLQVHQCLLTIPEVNINEITSVVSHPQAFAQCAQFLKNDLGHAKLVSWQDTAKAARDLSEARLAPTTAVIAPERSAFVYGLQVLRANIQDKNPNLTAFIVVKKPGGHFNKIKPGELWK